MHFQYTYSSTCSICFADTTVCLELLFVLTSRKVDGTAIVHVAVHVERSSWAHTHGMRPLTEHNPV
jgi:hypothetical protein